MIRFFRSQRGNALVPAMLIMSMLTVSGIAVLATVDTQQRETRRERVRESNFQLAEGLLNTQIFRLSKAWPGSASAGAGFPRECPTATPSPACPDSATLKKIFANVDQGDWATVNWKTHIRDDDDGANPSNVNFYSDALLPTGRHYDANGNDRLWVRAEGIVRGRKRVLVALVKAEVIESRLVPNQTVVAGWFRTTNQGSGQAKDFVVQEPGGGSVFVRCGTGAANELPANQNAGCADFKEDQHGSTVSPKRVYSRPSYGNAYEDPEAGVDALRDQAILQGNYVQSGCPTSLQGDVAGEIVFIENSGSGCSFQSNAVFNSPAAPGAVVIARGGPLTLFGTLKFYGLIYHANLQETVDNAVSSAQVLIKLQGNAQVEGGLFIDGFKGGVEIGSSGQGQLKHNPNAGDPLKTFGTAGIVQNSFRELRSPTGAVN